MTLNNNEDFRDYLKYGYDIIQDYKNWRRNYLLLNISFMTFFSLAINILIDWFSLNTISYLIFLIGFIYLLGSTSYNISYNLRKHKTEPREDTLLYYREHEIETFEKFKSYFDEKKEELLTNSNLKQLFNTFQFQSNYYNLLDKTRKISLFSILGFVISLLIAVLFLFIGAISNINPV